jgi:hypothetical protein
MPAKHAVGVSTAAAPIVHQFAGAVSVVLFVDLVSVLAYAVAASLIMIACAALQVERVSAVHFTVYTSDSLEPDRIMASWIVRWMTAPPLAGREMLLI